MRDEIDGRLWDAHGHAFSENLHALFTAAGAALARLRRRVGAVRWGHVATTRSRAGQA